MAARWLRAVALAFAAAYCPVRGERLSRFKNLSPLPGLRFAQTETTAFSRGCSSFEDGQKASSKISPQEPLSAMSAAKSCVWKLNLFAPPSRRGGRADQTNATLP